METFISCELEMIFSFPMLFTRKFAFYVVDLSQLTLMLDPLSCGVEMENVLF